MLKFINKSLEQTINTLIDITACLRFGVSLMAIDIVKRHCFYLSRIKIMISTLKTAYLIRAAKVLRRRYCLAKDPECMTVKKVFLAVNYAKSRKISNNDLAIESRLR